jgi:HEAT repeat protein
MTRRRLVLIGLLLVAGLGVAVLASDSPYTLWGRLRGEHFYHGRPACSWRAAIQGWFWPSTRNLKSISLSTGSPMPLAQVWQRLFGSGPEEANERPAVLSGDPEALPVLVDLLRDSDWVVRQEAALGLGNLGPAAAPAVPALAAALKDGDAGVRLSAAHALAWIGPAAGDAVPALTEALDDPVPGVQSAAAVALGKIGPGARAVVPALRRLLDAKAGSASESDKDLRMTVADGLWKIDGRADLALPVLLAGLADQRSESSALAAEALGAMGPEAKPAVPALLKAVQGPNPVPRDRAAQALDQIDPEAAPRAGVPLPPRRTPDL